MSRTTSSLLSAGETAHALRLALGPRQWRDFLADCIRGRGGLFGWLTLMPYAADKGDHPLYLPRDVTAFITLARRLDSSRTPGARLVAPRYGYDDTIGLPWRARLATLTTGGACR